MKILVLGGTSWLGNTLARVALERNHEVTCLPRGESGQVPSGTTFVRADRGEGTAYDRVRAQNWDGVVDVSWQPGFVRGAVSALAGRARTWVYVSSASVYAAHDIGADESAGVLPALVEDTATRERYGEAKVACDAQFSKGLAKKGRSWPGGPDRRAGRPHRSDRLMAVAAGLVCRPLEQTLTDVLSWELAQVDDGHDRPGRADLGPAQERQLIEAARARPGQR